jgi:serine/threonine-protein kinase
MGKKLGRYEILEELGRGAMGVVYRARDPLIDRFVAIKAIDLNSLNKHDREEYEVRFNLEARTAGGISHPNIVTIHDIGKSGDVFYISMELLTGRELESIHVSRTSVDPSS